MVVERAFGETRIVKKAPNPQPLIQDPVAQALSALEAQIGIAKGAFNEQAASSSPFSQLSGTNGIMLLAHMGVILSAFKLQQNQIEALKAQVESLRQPQPKA